jgi:hypothetical protein
MSFECRHAQIFASLNTKFRVSLQACKVLYLSIFILDWAKAVVCFDGCDRKKTLVFWLVVSGDSQARPVGDPEVYEHGSPIDFSQGSTQVRTQHAELCAQHSYNFGRRVILPYGPTSG